jgi:VanZ family protein
MAGNNAPSRHTQRHRIPAAVLLFLYMVCIFALSQQSRIPLPRPLARIPDSVLHVAAYVPLGFLLAVAAGPTHAEGAWIATAAASFFAVTDEFHQSLIPGREGTVSDCLQDAAGGAIGAWLAYLWRRGRKWRAGHKSPMGAP